MYAFMVYTGEVVHDVEVTRSAQKELRKVPVHVQVALFTWIEAVRREGLQVVRKVPGYHDEPLKGKRKGQRSIRLSRGWRAIYVIEKGAVEFVEVREVNHHDY